MKNKMKSGVVRAKDGDAIWQPGVKGNCITIKVSPWNFDETNHTVFLHEMPHSGEVPEHAHEANEEIFICLEGEAIITIDGKEFPFRVHDVAFISPLSKHSIRTVSEMPLKMMVVISPTGLEDRLKLMGIPKKSHEELPPESFDSEIGKSNTHGVV